MILRRSLPYIQNSYPVGVAIETDRESPWKARKRSRRAVSDLPDLIGAMREF